MKTSHDGGPAFPIPLNLGESWSKEAGGDPNGMTLRDYFAAKVLAGFLANQHQDYAPLIDDKVPMLAKEAYRLADAMLAARERKEDA